MNSVYQSNEIVVRSPGRFTCGENLPRARARRAIRVFCIAAALLMAGPACRLGGLGAAPLPTDIPTEPGTYTLGLDHDGMSRHYILHVPAGYDGATPLPVLFMLHGSFGSAEGASIYYGWREKADAEGLIAIFPQGAGEVETWNAAHCCGFARRRGVDDVGFIVAILDAASAVLAVDSHRVYATGMSNGAMMCHRLGAERPDIFAAIGPVAGTVGGEPIIGAPEELPPTPAAPLPVIMFHGTDDNFVLYGGGLPRRGALLGRIDASVAESVQFWVTADGCDSEPLIESLADGSVVRESYDCPPGAEIILYTIIGGGHAWPGGQLPRPQADPPTPAISATDTIWTFFAAHPRP